MSGTMHRRLAALEARHRSTPSYVVEVSDEDMADPVAMQAAIAKHQRQTGWTGPVIVALAEVTVEEWGERNRRI